MLLFISSQFSFYFSLFMVLFLPGYSLVRFINIKFGFFTKLEEFVLSAGFSIFISNSLILILGALNVKITKWTFLASVICFSLAFLFSEKIFLQKSAKKNPEKKFLFSSKQQILIFLILILSIFFRTIYLRDTMLPSATDMGHHMYWTNMIVQEGNIPNYQQADVVFKNGNYAISQPQNISDFIIGEHLIFSAIALVSGLSVISYFPTLVLFVINIFSLLAIFILTLRLFEKSKEKINISILTLFLLGPLFALAPPQAKFISGGVVGNIIGNFLLPLTFYFFLRAMREKNKIMLLFALVFSMNLFYTHHLTALLFALSMIIVLLLFLVTNLKNILYILKTWSSLFFSLPVLSFLFFSFIFAFFVYTPTYITNQAVKTVIGSPKKIEHTGLSMAQFKDAIGEPRLALAIFGILILSYALLKGLGSQRKNFSYEKIPFHIFFLFGWIGAISTISLFPQLVKIGIPSARVANYGVYPFAITASFCLAFLFFKKDDDGKRNYSVRPGFFFSILTVIATYLIVSGFYDNSQNMAQLTSPQKINQTFNASEFLARNVSGDDQIQSDHIYIKADAWTKIFLMKDYNFPLYRANFERYENGIDKNEKCTLNMISSPNEPDSQKCFSDLNVKYIMVSGKNDSSQFQNNDSFWQIYSNNEINIYYRKAQ